VTHRCRTLISTRWRYAFVVVLVLSRDFNVLPCQRMGMIFICKAVATIEGGTAE
jgi:hypothetical protein